MNNFEKNLLHNHNLSHQTRIIGCDEAGRGAWAGPVVIAGVVFPAHYYNPNIRDSKQLSQKQRAILAQEIKAVAIKYMIVIINAAEVDQLNPKQSSIKGMKIIVNTLGKGDSNYCGFIDGEKITHLKIPCIQLIKGDSLSQSIGAASILAKTTHDQIMINMHKKYPQYNFNRNMGYGTADHQKALEKYQACKIHRQSYKPIKNLNQQKLKLLF